MQIIRYLMDGNLFGAMLEIVVLALILIILIPIHEYAHAFTAYKLGDDTQKWMGRLTLNPMKHLDPYGSVLMVLFGFGWGKPVKIDSRRFKNYKAGMALTAAAGPISNIIVAFAASFIARAFTLFYSSVPALGIIAEVFSLMAFVSISLAFFNLIPVYPLDGSRILSLILPTKLEYKISQYSTYFIIGLLLLVRFTVVGDWLSWLISAVDYGIYWLADSLFNLVGLTIS